MALMDSAELLARCKRDSGLPSTGNYPADADWYAWISQAELYWKPKVAAVYPYHMFGAPVLMTSADGGITYTFSTEVAPLAVEVYSALNGHRLKVSQYGDQGDYVWEGSQIRMPGNVARTFANGPYARYVASPIAVSSGVEPTLKPLFARQLLVDRALIYWARVPNGTANADELVKREAETWANVQESLKQSNPFYGDASNRGSSRLSGIGYLGMRGLR